MLIVLCNMFTSGMDLHISGLGPLSVLAGSVRSWLRGAISSHAAPALAAQLQHELRAALAELRLWEVLHAKH